MAGGGTIATTQIITKGLACTHCIEKDGVRCNLGLITAQFSLYIAPINKRSGGGGAYPGKAWNKLEPGELKNFYQPVNPAVGIFTKRSLNTEEHILINVKIKLRDIDIKRTYSVPKRHERVVINIYGIVNMVIEKLTPIVSNISRMVPNIKVQIRRPTARNINK